jgi:hypothetical protein
VRVVRDGGWSGGPDPDALVGAVLAALPQALEAAIAGAGLPAGADATIASVQVRAAVDLRALRAGDVPVLEAAIAAPIRDVVRREAVLEPPRSPVSEASAGPADGAPDGLPPRAPVIAFPGARELLVRWLDGGQLDRMLSLLSDATLEAWATRALAPALGGTGPAADVDPALLAMVEDVLGGAAAPAAGPALVRARLALAAATASHAGDWARATALIDAARPRPADAPGAAPTAGDRRRGVPAEREPAPHAPIADTRGEPGLRPPAAESGPGAARSVRPAAAREPVVVAALPFLMLVPLSRIGYLDVLAAALDAAGIAGAGDVFGAALARKLLDPPERGWRRAAAAGAATAALAGRDVPEPKLMELARYAPRFASALDAVIATSLVAGRGEEPLVLHRTAAGELMLLDPLGGFLIAVSPDAEPLARVLRAGVRPAVRMTSAVASEPATAATFAAAGVPAGAQAVAPPGRVDELLAALTARCSVPRAADATLERSLTLAAALGLGSLAWDMWSGERATDPLLTLERFGDLEARVHVEPDRVRVALPLGQRHDDLRAAGLLADLPCVPWLGGRRLELGAG